MKAAIVSLCWKPNRSAPTPSWKTSTISPYAAPTESRFMMIALTGRTMERNTISKSTKLSASTNAMTIGRYVFIVSM